MNDQELNEFVAHLRDRIASAKGIADWKRSLGDDENAESRLTWANGVECALNDLQEARGKSICTCGALQGKSDHEHFPECPKKVTENGCDHSWSYPKTAKEANSNGAITCVKCGKEERRGNF